MHEGLFNRDSLSAMETGKILVATQTVPFGDGKTTFFLVTSLTFLGAVAGQKGLTAR